MKNVFEDQLGRLTFHDIFQTVVDVGQEGQRLELKEQLSSKRKIAYVACSMANSIGGLIVVGIKDIKEPGDPVEIAVVSPDISDAAQGSLANVIQAMIYPPMSRRIGILSP